MFLTTREANFQGRSWILWSVQGEKKPFMSGKIFCTSLTHELRDPFNISINTTVRKPYNTQWLVRKTTLHDVIWYFYEPKFRVLYFIVFYLIAAFEVRTCLIKVINLTEQLGKHMAAIGFAHSSACLSPLRLFLPSSSNARYSINTIVSITVALLGMGTRQLDNIPVEMLRPKCAEVYWDPFQMLYMHKKWRWGLLPQFWSTCSFIVCTYVCIYHSICILPSLYVQASLHWQAGINSIFFKMGFLQILFCSHRALLFTYKTLHWLGVMEVFPSPFVHVHSFITCDVKSFQYLECANYMLGIII